VQIVNSELGWWADWLGALIRTPHAHLIANSIITDKRWLFEPPEEAAERVYGSFVSPGLPLEPTLQVVRCSVQHSHDDRTITTLDRLLGTLRTSEAGDDWLPVVAQPPPEFISYS
jgi:hypothetical protein